MKWLDGFLNWFKKAAPVTSVNGFAPEERRVYRYWAGLNKGWVEEDPADLYRKMTKVGVELNLDMKLAYSISKDADQGYDAMIEKMRSIFDVKKFKEGGLLDSELIEEFDKFNTYCTGIQKKTKNSAISQTETQQPSSSSSAESPPTKSGSDSGSTDSVSSSEGPPPCSMPSPP